MRERERDSVPEELRLEKLIVITSVPEVGGKRISAGPPPRSYRNPMQESGRGNRLPDQGKRYRGRVLCEFQCLVSRAVAPLPLGRFLGQDKNLQHHLNCVYRLTPGLYGLDH